MDWCGIGGGRAYYKLNTAKQISFFTFILVKVHIARMLWVNATHAFLVERAIPAQSQLLKGRLQNVSGLVGLLIHFWKLENKGSTRKSTSGSMHSVSPEQGERPLFLLAKEDTKRVSVCVCVAVVDKVNLTRREREGARTQMERKSWSRSPAPYLHFCCCFANS